MEKNKKIKIMQTSIIVILCVFLILSYDIANTGVSLFQVYVMQYRLGANEFSKLTILGSLILSAIMILSLFNTFQKYVYQRVLLGVLLLTVIILPMNIVTYPVVSGFSSAMSTLADAWRQLFVPPAIRATVTGITTGIMGFFDIRSITVENQWFQVMARYRYLLFILAVGFVLFCWLSIRLKDFKIDSEQVQDESESIIQLFVRYPYIFIIGIFTGFNASTLSYTYLIGLKILPYEAPKIYQYIMSIGGVILPIIIGRFADKLGIFFTVLCVGFMLAGCKILTSGLGFLHITTPAIYYILAFVEAGFATSLWSLESSLIGERLRTKGIFRSFALSNIMFSVGAILYGRVFARFNHSFIETKLLLGIISLLFLGLLLYLYFQQKKTLREVVK